MKNILKQTCSLLYFQVILLVKQQASKFLGEVAMHCEKETQSLSSSHCPFTIQQAVKSSECQPHFLPSNLPCGSVLCDGAHKKSIEKQKTAAVDGLDDVLPVHVWGYTPSSMPMKSEPFCIVMEAPAALSTNMEVYCPACKGKIQ